MNVVLKSSLIAPCGMNCGLCYAFQREKNKCPGCNYDNENKPKYCIGCSIKNCESPKNNNSKFCFACQKYPCKRLKELDKRYRTKYGISMIENLYLIKVVGIRKFLKSEKEKWACPNCGNIISVHEKECLDCSTNRVFE